MYVIQLLYVDAFQVLELNYHYNIITSTEVDNR